MNKKGFTLIELLGVILILSIVIGIAIIAVNNSIKRSKDKTFKVLVSSLEDATLQAYTECLIDGGKPFCLTYKLSNVTTTTPVRITLNSLINGGYIDSINNPYSSGEKCDGNASYVEISLGSIDTTDVNSGISDWHTKLYDYLLDINSKYVYKSCLVCGDKRSDGCQ